MGEEQVVMSARNKPGKTLVSYLVTGHAHCGELIPTETQCWAGMSDLCLKPQNCPPGTSVPVELAQNELSQTRRMWEQANIPWIQPACPGAGDALLCPTELSPPQGRGFLQCPNFHLKGKTTQALRCFPTFAAIHRH